MKPTIHLALTHDWELRGDGSGEIEQIQFAPLRRLQGIYAEAGVRTTILPDVMQQLAFRRYQTEYPELKAQADSWDQHLRDAFLAGHDVQLHLHPQWRDARYENGHWVPRGDWSILNYDRDTAHAMLAAAKQYLEELLQPLDTSYGCLAFRAGALAVAPSAHLLNSLADLGIKLDVSLAAGLFVDHQNLQLDYRNCEETFLPFYPMMEDARRVSNKIEPVICVPLNYFYGSRRAVTKQNISLASKQIQEPRSAANAGSAKEKPTASRIGLAYEKLVVPMIKRKYFVSDTGRLNYALLREMMTSIRERARLSGLTDVPVVLTNHPKDIRDLAAIERFVKEAAQADDIRFITLRDLAGKLDSGAFKIRSAQ